MSLEERAIDLDEARKARILKSEVIDVEKYLHSNDVTIKVKKATDWLDSIKESYLASDRPKPVVMPWSITHESFAFRDGEVTVYAGGNGGTGIAYTSYTNGTGGKGADGGNIYIWDLANTTYTITTGTGGSTNSGQTGGTGGSCLVSL